MYLTENLQEKWQPVLEHPDLPKIGDSYKRAVTTVILENQEKAVREDAAFMTEAAPTNSVAGGGVNNWDPVLISLVVNRMLWLHTLPLLQKTLNMVKLSNHILMVTKFLNNKL